jgi:hypothetical protein
MSFSNFIYIMVPVSCRSNLASRYLSWTYTITQLYMHHDPCTLFSILVYLPVNSLPILSSLNIHLPFYHVLGTPLSPLTILYFYIPCVPPFSGTYTVSFTQFFVSFTSFCHIAHVTLRLLMLLSCHWFFASAPVILRSATMRTTLSSSALTKRSNVV